MPFLIRRVGFRAAYRMTLAAPGLDAEEALRIGLVDAAGPGAEEALRRLFLACGRVPERTVAAAKAYFDGLAPMAPAVENYAVGRIASLLADPANAARIRELMAQGVWQGGQAAAAP
jgi:polyketide biosynthesis enoyl-CoA hydratase PksH